MGATLSKLAADQSGEGLALQARPTRDLDGVAAALAATGCESVGVTGGGGARLAERLDCPTFALNEFAAWAAGARMMLAEQQGAAPARFLVVSIGTGTSVLLVDGMSAQRIGGTALGGGTAVGLGLALSGAADFDELCQLAAKGDAARVDLMVSDIYRPGEIPLAGDITAANFGRLATKGAEGCSPEDFAAGVMNLVGENVGLVCGGLAAAAQVTVVAFGGSTLLGNPALVRSLTTVTSALGREPILLRDGEYTGARGALELARAR